MRGLEIRCAYAYGLVLEKIHGTKSEIVQDAMEDVRDAAEALGASDAHDLTREVPLLFAGTALAGVWEYGFREASGQYMLSQLSISY